MAVGLDWRAVNWRAWARPREFAAPQLQKAIEYGLIGLIAGASIALVWALAAPTVRDDAASAAPVRFDASPAAFESFDPFFRLATGSGQPGVVTSLNLTLHGIRSDRASGRGSAIIGLPDGTQNSYAVGDEIAAGAILSAVQFDHVAIRREGANETLYLDQSTSAPIVQGAAAAMQPDPFAAIRAPGTGRTRPPLIADISAEPRMRHGQVDGYVLKPGSSGTAFADAGLMPGDVLLTIDGRKVGEGAGMEQLAGLNRPVAIGIERGGKMLTLTVGRGQ